MPASASVDQLLFVDGLHAGVPAAGRVAERAARAAPPPDFVYYLWMKKKLSIAFFVSKVG